MAKLILCPITFNLRSSYVSAALPVAAREAQLHGAELCIMTVVPESASSMDLRYVTREGGGTASSPKQLVKQAQERLKEVADEFVPEEVSSKLLVRVGTIYKEILEAANELKADWIILGAHRPSMKDFLLGTNADRVVRHAKCSVTVVR